MAVILERAEPYRTCGSCESNKDVVTLKVMRKVGNTNMGTEVALCAECAKKLVEAMRANRAEKKTR